MAGSSCAGPRTRPVVEVVKRSPAAKGFEVLRRRWVVERTFAWIVKNRRFVRDYEQLTAVAETLIIIAATATLIRRWPSPTSFSNTLLGLTRREGMPLVTEHGCR